MSIQVSSDTTTHHEFIARKRNLIVQRLVRVLDALDNKRHKVSEVVSDVASFIPGHSSSSSTSSSSGSGLALPAGDSARNALIGAAAGGAVFALGLLLEHRRRERNRPLRVIQRAWFKYAMPPQPSLISRLVTEAVGSLVLSVAQEAARSTVNRLIEGRSSADGPRVLDRVSDTPDPTFVTEPVTVDPGALKARDAELPTSGIAPPEPIAPMPSPLREFT